MKKLLLLLFFCLLAVRGYCADKPAKLDTLTKQSGKETYKITRGADNDEVVIGDEKNPSTFKNKITFKKWFNDKQGDYENSLSIIPPADLIPNATITQTGDQLLIRNNTIGFYYNKDPTSEDNFKFGLILYEIPDAKVVVINGKEYYQWSFQLEGWEDFYFSYQGIWVNYEEVYLTKEQSPFDIVGIHHRKLDEPMKGALRLPEAEGSYAIYHKTKRDYIVGKTNYKTGKAYHDFRPKFISSDGKIEWTILDYKNGLRTISVLKDWIDNAIYPIKANDWFGSQAIGTTSGAGDNSKSLCSMSNMPSGGAITSITFYTKCSARSGVAKGEIFDDDGTAGDPLTLLGVGVETTTTVTANWFTSNLSLSLNSGTYGVAWICPTDTGNLVSLYSDNKAGTIDFRDFNCNYASPTNWAGTVEVVDKINSQYATYTPIGVTLSGTIISSTTETDIKAGGKTIILTMTGDTWVADGATFNAQRQNIIDGLDSAGLEEHGWDAEVKAKIPVTDVVRTSDTVVTITLSAETGYYITTNETITATVPATATTSGNPYTATPTFTVSPPTATISQYHFRFRNDDSNETLATWADTQDTNVYRIQGNITRFRALIDTTSNADTKQYELDYKLSTDSTWTKIPTNSSQIQYFSWNYTPTGDNTFAGTWSGSLGTRYQSIDDYPDSAGSDYLTHGTTAGNATFNFTTPVLPNDASNIDVNLYYYDRDNTNGTNKVQGMLMIGGLYYNATQHEVGALPSYTNRVDSWGTNPRTSSEWTITDINTGGSNDLQKIGWRSGDANPSIRLTSLMLQVNFTNYTTLPFVMQLSPNFSDNDTTTYQLDAPSGKSGANNFTAGYMLEATNPPATLDLARDKYTEYEWCFNTTTYATNGNIYGLRVSASGTALDNYLVNATMTIGTTPAPPANLTEGFDRAIGRGIGKGIL